MGLEADTGITPGQYNLALAIFFISYCKRLFKVWQRANVLAIFEPPSNVLLKKLKPRYWISFM